MDCLRFSGDADYVCFTCCSSTHSLNELVDRVSGDPSLGIRRVVTRIVLERVKWYLGYPLDRLKWLEE